MMTRRAFFAALLASAAVVWIPAAQAAYQGSAPLLVPNGGTGGTTFTAHGPLVGEGTGALVALSPVAGSIMNQTSAGSDPAMTVTPVIGVAGTSTGTVGLSGITSGVVTIQPQSAAGTYNFNLPTSAGSSGQILTSGGGGGAAMTWGAAPAVGITVATASGSGPFTLATTNQLTTISSMGTPAAATYNLPAIQAAGWRECLKDGTTNFGTNNATVKPNPTSLTIDGVAGTTGIVLNTAHQEACFISDGTNWFVE